MKPQFDPGQLYQLEAISAMVDLFDGQPKGAGAMTVIQAGERRGNVRRAGTYRTWDRQPTDDRGRKAAE